MQLGDRGGTYHRAPFPHRFRIRDLAAADARERAIHQIGPDLSFQHRKAPVPHVFQDEEP